MYNFHYLSLQKVMAMSPASFSLDEEGEWLVSTEVVLVLLVLSLPQLAQFLQLHQTQEGGWRRVGKTERERGN